MKHLATRTVHAPEESPAAGPPGAPAPPGRGGLPHMPALHQSTAFTFENVRRGIEAFQGSGDYLYTRKANPTVRALERHLAALESAPVETPAGARSPGFEVDSRFFASGMAAIAATLLSAGRGQRLICQSGIYGTTEKLAGELGSLGVEVEFVPVGDLGALSERLSNGPPPAMIHIESPANPLLQVTDVEAAAALAHDVGALLSVDATFATPILLRPLAWGADFSIHSTTKFISGYGVALGGVVSGAADRVDQGAGSLRTLLGGSADPFAAWLTHLGLRTLEVRMRRHSANAAALVRFLREHPRILDVFQAGPAQLPEGQLAGVAPMLSFELEGGEAAALSLIDALELITLAPTLGTLDTLVQHPFSMSHVVLSVERRIELGVRPGIVRLSVGLEEPDDLIADLDSALSRLT